MEKNSIEHPDFGTLVWNEDFERYATSVGHGPDAFDLGFEESDANRLAELLDAAASLWRDREKWLAQWRKSCFKYYVNELKAEWYEGEEPLDEDRFNEKIGQPAGIDFSWNDGNLHYMITGMDDDLIGDHALEAHGTGLTPDEICLT